MIKKTSDFLWAAIFAFLTFIAVNQSWVLFQDNQQWSRDQQPISDWFTPTQLYVPDFASGTDPQIVYDRTIKQAFHVIWSVNVQKILDSGFANVCTNLGSADFTPELKLPPDGITLNKFVGKDCSLKEGKYRIYVTWTVLRQSYSNVRLNLISNVFTVS